MGSDELIDSHVSLAQSQKAVKALLQHVRKQQQQLDETELLPAREQHVWLVLTVKRMQPTKTLKPQKIPLAHPLVDPRTSSVCLITKDPQREYKDLLESHDVKFISRVVGMQKLRGKFKGFDARRLLLRENDLFLADERVLPLLPRLLGKKWFEAKKQPIPVSLTKKGLKTELENAISSTYMHQNQGTCTSIKIATTSHKDSQVLANLTTALPTVIARIHGGWENVQSLNIKTSTSVSLPIWTCPLGSDLPGSRWDGMVLNDEGEWGGFGAGVEDGGAEAVVEAEPAKETPKTNGKKRAAQVTEETHDGVNKKAKKVRVTEDSTSTSGPAGLATEHTKKSNSKPTASQIAQETDDPASKSTKKFKSKPTESNPATRETDSPTAKPIKKPKSRPTESSPAAKETDAPTPVRARKADEKSTAAAPKSALKKAKTPQSSPAISTPKKSLTRAELTEKKDVLDGAQLVKKKSKLRDTEKSARKGVKASLVGRVRA